MIKSLEASGTCNRRIIEVMKSCGLMKNRTYHPSVRVLNVTDQKVSCKVSKST
ncbi:hypothetical protein [Methanobacterium sp.]|uniref:hypothetical protein n=1 Tax=Methanobacterium sp. TaxID=2164 RepID=UPI0025E876F6|nr:hypothetical protein [Methanobacterium sp.]MBI5460130.1 hypothetical protein [Methanobacterium sp.]